MALATENTELPKESPVLHPWMYSFLPANNNFYLLAYCKGCDTALSVHVPHNFGAVMKDVRMTVLGIPKIGCRVPDYLRTQ